MADEDVGDAGGKRYFLSGKRTKARKTGGLVKLISLIQRES